MIAFPLVGKKRKNNFHPKCLSKWRALLCVAMASAVFVVRRFVLNTSRSAVDLLLSTGSLPEEKVVEGQVRTVRVRDTRHKPVYPFKTILLWTTYFGQNYSNDFYFFEEGQQTFRRYDCEVWSCRVTADSALLHEADAILFHGPDIVDEILPENTRSDQIKIIYNLEPPTHFAPIRKKDYFNWTMTYRWDSDVPVKYGLLLKNDHAKSAWSADSTEYHFEARKDAAVMMVSNCKTDSRREAYVRELQKYYNVDVYGSCGPYKCTPPQSSHCYETTLKRYKFYLAFENSICRDYVTEKFFNALKYAVVPVVLGGANYSVIAPSDSFIDTMDFPDPKDLAIFLKKVGGHPKKYEKYLAWKTSYRVYLHPWMCDLCEKLHGKSNIRVVSDFEKWWRKEARCRRWKKGRGFIPSCKRSKPRQ